MFKQVKEINVEGLTEDQVKDLYNETEKANRIKSYVAFGIVCGTVSLAVGVASHLINKKLNNKTELIDEVSELAGEVVNKTEQSQTVSILLGNSQTWHIVKQEELPISTVIEELVNGEFREEF